MADKDRSLKQDIVLLVIGAFLSVLIAQGVVIANSWYADYQDTLLFDDLNAELFIFDCGSNDTYFFESVTLIINNPNNKTYYNDVEVGIFFEELFNVENDSFNISVLNYWQKSYAYVSDGNYKNETRIDWGHINARGTLRIDLRVEWKKNTVIDTCLIPKCLIFINNLPMSNMVVKEIGVIPMFG